MDSIQPCLCCLERPPDKALKIAYHYHDRTEIYAEMLKDCFQIHVNIDKNMDGGSGICDTCVARLRDAQDFKCQVQHCQQILTLLQVDSVKDKSEAEINQEQDLVELDEIVAFQSERNDFNFEEMNQDLSEHTNDTKESSGTIKDDGSELSEKLWLPGDSIEQSFDSIELCGDSIELCGDSIELSGVSIEGGDSSWEQPPRVNINNEMNLDMSEHTNGVEESSAIHGSQLSEHLWLPGNSIEQGGDSIEQGGDSIEQGGDSIEHGGDSIEHGGDSIEQGGDSIEHGGDSIEHGGDSSWEKPPRVNINNNDRKSKRAKTSLGSLESPVKSKTENQKQCDNFKNILKYSNATPFWNVSLSGIVCVYCRKTYSGLEELRTHITNSHRNDDIPQRQCKNDRWCQKLDIIDLKCNLCEADMNDTSNLKQHLTKEHGIKFHPDVLDCILEFKLTESEMFNCALCPSTYETFKMLQQHTNGHYRNYVCDSCDMGFITKDRLKTHERSHQVGVFPCTFCDKVFTAFKKKNSHEKYTHSTSSRYKTSCPVCNESFTDYYPRNKHMLEEHDIKTASYCCKCCDKTFITKSLLTDHIKKAHLMHRNHKCTICGRAFYKRLSLEEHMIKHNGDKVFKCIVCSKSYAREKTLREHMRIHNDERRFKCGFCVKTFVQKCSLKSHMMTRHGATLSAPAAQNNNELPCLD